ncbi:MAG: PadR family transcriptional regulator, partial [Solirubrobacterales bacterium]|nr:PadR family transcriptional regulator [Solirubrobacterales bacterium]
MGFASESIEPPARGYELRIVQEVLLALLAGESSHGYELRTRLALALGPLAESLSDGQVYVTLGRLQRAGLVRSKRVDQTDRLER